MRVPFHVLLVVAAACGDSTTFDEVEATASAPARPLEEPETVAPDAPEIDGVPRAPAVLSALPDEVAASDTLVRLIFSTAMDASATSAAFALFGEEQQVSGQLAWDVTRTVVAFRPSAELVPGEYVIHLTPLAKSEDGLNLEKPFVAYFNVQKSESDDKL